MLALVAVINVARGVLIVLVIAIDTEDLVATVAILLRWATVGAVRTHYPC